MAESAPDQQGDFECLNDGMSEALAVDGLEALLLQTGKEKPLPGQEVSIMCVSCDLRLLIGKAGANYAVLTGSVTELCKRLRAKPDGS